METAAAATAELKLNLGCGNKHLQGFVNVDLESNWCLRKPNMAADVAKPLPLPDGVVDEVHAYHLVEHFYRWEAFDILADWVRVLKPGGLLVIELPCLDKILSIMQHCIATQTEMPENLTMWGLYGDPGYGKPEMCHRWCYSIAEMTAMLEELGLEVTSTEPQTHKPIRDMRLEGRKCL